MEENKEKTAEAYENDEVKVGEVVGEDGFSEKDKADNKVMAILSYISFLTLIPYLLEKDSKWVRFNAIQGMNLFIIELISWVIGFIPLIGWLISGAINIVMIIISVIGIINVCNEEAKELPIVNKFKFIKK